MNATLPAIDTAALLFEATVELARLGGTENPVYRECLAALKRETAPLSTTIGELAERYDIPAADALQSVIDAGCRLFWWEGKPHGVDGIRAQIKSWWRWDITPEIQVDLSPEERAAIEAVWGEKEAVAA